MVDFNFEQTCQIIDGGIDNIKLAIENIIEDINEPLMQHIDSEEKEKLINSFYEQWFKDIIEDLRQTNVDMRQEAEKQLNELAEKYEREIEALKEEIGELRKEIL